MRPVPHSNRSSALIDESNPTPLILMLDEPETWLHPSAQLKLGEALSKIGEQKQFFIVTHSPYLIRKFDAQRHLLTVLAGHGKDRRIDHSTAFGLFGMGELTWGEINYRAFDVCSNDFHNELYGRVQRHVDTQKSDGRSASEKEIDGFLVAEGNPQTKTWIRTSSQRYPATLSVYVRNSIHHPENSLNLAVTADELRESTKTLVAAVEKINAVP
ncbi:AAA family ATPase [Glutamicibacter arilaitensis]|uniref:AAA family ATPase n=1 Tax=Glutamicibacter arilaitensis TaxID=256701 RepID=UPI003FD0F24B